MLTALRAFAIALLLLAAACAEARSPDRSPDAEPSPSLVADLPPEPEPTLRVPAGELPASPAGSTPSAQRVLEVPPQRACECSITLSRVAVLGGENDPGVLGAWAHIAVDRRGRFFTTGAAPTAMHLFDSRGRYLRSLGTEGAGPGEFRIVLSPVIARDGSIHVVDIGNARISIFSPELEFLRAVPLGAARDPQLVVTDGGSLVLHSNLLTPAHAGYPLHRLDASGRIRKSFGAAQARLHPGQPWEIRRRIAPAAGDRVWSARQNQYLIERWSADGTKDLEIRREADWFRPWSDPGPPAHEAPPRPRVVDVREDGEGRLWVLLHVADHNWQPRRLRTVNGEGVMSPEDFDALFGSLIEVIDVESGQLLAYGRVPRMIYRFAGDDLVYTYREDQIGTPYYELWRLRLTQQP